MKLSIFNSYLELSAATGVIYNSLIDKSVFIPVAALNDISSGHCSDVSSDVEEVAFVNDGCDEFQIYHEQVLAAENQKYSYHLIINPTLDCIFNCWYCYEEHPKGRMPVEILERIKLLISKIAETYESLTISFFGGEPMMCYSSVIIPVLKYAHTLFKDKGKRFSCSMTTNGYLFTEDRIKELKQYGFNSAQITLDGNAELHNSVRCLKNNKPSYRRIVDNIRRLVESECYITLRFNCTHANVESFKNVADDLVIKEEFKKYLAIDSHIVWQEKEKDRLQASMHRLIAEFASHDLNASKMDFRSFCYADKRSECVVNYNGDLYKCTAKDFHNTPRDGYLASDGEIVWENDSHERRMNSKLKNQKCHSCRILPLCHGGCTRHSLESQGEYCIYPTEDMKDQVVINRLEHIITNHKSIKS